jgi:hypothetical protein
MRPYLLLALPTVARPNGKDYINPTLKLIKQQLYDDPRDPRYGRIVLYVVKHGTNEHAAFDLAKTIYENDPSGSFKFVVNDRVIAGNNKNT